MRCQKRILALRTIASQCRLAQAGTQVFLVVSVDGRDKTLVAKLQAILAENGLTKTTTISSLASYNRQSPGVSVSTSFGTVRGAATVAEITVGLKPTK
jgi:hypothetical protein